MTNPNLWWPYLMDPEPGYLYTLEVTATNGQQVDVYRQRFGVRQVTWENGLEINHKVQ